MCLAQRHIRKVRLSARTNSFRFGAWKVGKQRIGNALTGIRGDKQSGADKDGGGFAYVGTDSRLDRLRRRQMFVLESALFSLDGPATLHFDIYRRSNDISLQVCKKKEKKGEGQVCLDDLTTCPYEAGPVEKDVYWKEAEAVPLPAATKKIFFVATQSKKFKWLALDNIRLEDADCLGRII